MGTQIWNKVMVFAGLAIAALLFQNFDFALRLNPIKEEIRVSHAKELLGLEEFKNSSASRAGSVPALNLSLYNEVYANLAERDKHLAPAITSTIIQESAKYHIDPVFVTAIIQTESQFNPRIVGTVGEIGLMQIRPTTAEWIAKKKKLVYKGRNSLFTPSENIKLGVAYVAWLRDKFSKKAGVYVTAYNVGAKRVRSLNAQERIKQQYSARVLTNYRRTYASIVAGKDPRLVANN